MIERAHSDLKYRVRSHEREEVRSPMFAARFHPRASDLGDNPSLTCDGRPPCAQFLSGEKTRAVVAVQHTRLEQLETLRLAANDRRTQERYEREQVERDQATLDRRTYGRDMARKQQALELGSVRLGCYTKGRERGRMTHSLC